MLLTSYNEGRISRGTPRAMNIPCFQLTERFRPPSATPVSSDIVNHFICIPDEILCPPESKRADTTGRQTGGSEELSNISEEL